MYPEPELIRLATRKAALRGRIARRRAGCADDIARATRPLVLFDRGLAFWRRVAPLAKVLALPAGILLGRAALPRQGIFKRLVRWSPVAIAAWRGLANANRRAR